MKKFLKYFFLIVTLIPSFVRADKSSDTQTKKKLVLAVGANYSWPHQLVMPDYLPRLKNALSKKGYEVIKEISVGTYVEHPYVQRISEELKADAIAIFRPGLMYFPPIGSESDNQRWCRISLDLTPVESVTTFLPVIIERESTFSRWYSSRHLCSVAIAGILSQIPDVKNLN